MIKYIIAHVNETFHHTGETVIVTNTNMSHMLRRLMYAMDTMRL